MAGPERACASPAHDAPRPARGRPARPSRDVERALQEGYHEAALLDVPHRDRRRRHVHGPGRGRRRGARSIIAKAASTPPGSSPRGCSTASRLLAAELGTDLAGLLAQTERIVHGTTVATNALLERKGARVGLLTTEGHRDVIEMREGLKDDRYNLRMPPPVPLVPRARRLGVRERMRFDGTVTTPLDRALARRARSRRSTAAGVEAVAVCYLHAYRNPRHERRDRRATSRGGCPGVYVSLSSRGAAADQGVRARVDDGGQRLRRARRWPAISPTWPRGCARHGYRGDVLIMQSHGGVAPVARVGAARRGRRAVGPGGRRGRRPPRARGSLGERRPDHLRHGRHQHRHRAAPGRRADS